MTPNAPTSARAPRREITDEDVKEGLRQIFTRKRLWFNLALLFLAMAAGIVFAALRFARKI